MKLGEGSTPGPWSTGKGRCHTVFGPKINGHRQVVVNCPTQSGERDYDSIQVFANASLIAKAPLLIEAQTLCLSIIFVAGNSDQLRKTELGKALGRQAQALLTKLESEEL